MALGIIGLIFVIGVFFWGGWPLLAQKSDVADPMVRGFLVNIVTALAFVPFLRGKMSWSTAWSTGGRILIAAGLLNFVGHALFPKLQTMAGSQISAYMPIILALCVTVSVVGGILFYQDQVTAPKLLFAALIVVGFLGLAFTAYKG